MSNALEILEARALGGACPRLSLVGGEGEQKQPGETNTGTYKQGLCLLQKEKGPIQLWALGAQRFLQAWSSEQLRSYPGTWLLQATCDLWLQRGGSGGGEAGHIPESVRTKAAALSSKCSSERPRHLQPFCTAGVGFTLSSLPLPQFCS